MAAQPARKEIGCAAQSDLRLCEGDPASLTHKRMTAGLLQEIASSSCSSQLRSSQTCLLSLPSCSSPHAPPDAVLPLHQPEAYPHALALNSIFLSALEPRAQAYRLGSAPLPCSYLYLVVPPLHCTCCSVGCKASCRNRTVPLPQPANL
jgi:hypothetical protein